MSSSPMGRLRPYDRSPETLSQAHWERYFFLDDVDRRLVETKRRDHHELGFSLRLATVRNVGAFLEDPLDVPVALVGYLAEQLGMADSPGVKSAPRAHAPENNYRQDGLRRSPAGLTRKTRNL